MSAETITSLNDHTLIGYTDKRGNAWHWREGNDNHYTDAVPVEDVRSRLFNWQAVEGSVTATHLTEEGVMTSNAPAFKAIMRSDTGHVLHIPKQSYTIHQYDETLIDVTADIVDASTGELGIGSAGLLNQGGRAWVQVELGDNWVAGNGVEFRPFLTAATSLDGSLSTTYLTGATVVVCDNTLSLALHEATDKYKVRHSRYSMARVGEAREALHLVAQSGEEFAAQVDKLTSEVVTDRQWGRFLDAYVPRPDAEGRALTIAENKRADLNRLWMYDARVAPWKGSAWGVLSAVNTWANHEQSVRTRTRSERNMEKLIDGSFEKLDAGVLATLARV